MFMCQLLCNTCGGGTQDYSILVPVQFRLWIRDLEIGLDLNNIHSLSAPAQSDSDYVFISGEIKNSKIYILLSKYGSFK